MVKLGLYVKHNERGGERHRKVLGVYNLNGRTVVEWMRPTAGCGTRPKFRVSDLTVWQQWEWGRRPGKKQDPAAHFVGRQ